MDNSPAAMTKIINAAQLRATAWRAIEKLKDGWDFSNQFPAMNEVWWKAAIEADSFAFAAIERNRFDADECGPFLVEYLLEQLSLAQRTIWRQDTTSGAYRPGCYAEVSGCKCGWSISVRLFPRDKCPWGRWPPE